MIAVLSGLVLYCGILSVQMGHRATLWKTLLVPVPGPNERQDLT